MLAQLDSSNPLASFICSSVIHNLLKRVDYILILIFKGTQSLWVIPDTRRVEVGKIQRIVLDRGLNRFHLVVRSNLRKILQRFSCQPFHFPVILILVGQILLVLLVLPQIYQSKGFARFPPLQNIMGIPSSLHTHFDPRLKFLFFE
jgi:hypothetical protein